MFSRRFHPGLIMQHSVKPVPHSGGLLLHIAKMVQHKDYWLLHKDKMLLHTDFLLQLKDISLPVLLLYRLRKNIFTQRKPPDTLPVLTFFFKKGP